MSASRTEYTPLTWVNEETELSAENLNHIEAGVALNNALAIENALFIDEIYSAFIESFNVTYDSATGSFSISFGNSSTERFHVSKSVNIGSNDSVKIAATLNTVYGKDASGNEANIYYSSDYNNKSWQLVIRDANSDVLVPDTPTSDNGATSKKYVAANFVALAGAQTITGAKTFNPSNNVKIALGEVGNKYNKIRFIGRDINRYYDFGIDNEYHFSLTNYYSGILLDIGEDGGFKIKGEISPINDATSVLGTSSYRWKDIYLSGGINPNSSGYKLAFPDTSSFTADSQLLDTVSDQTVTGTKTFKEGINFESNDGTKNGRIFVTNNRLLYIVVNGIQVANFNDLEGLSVKGLKMWADNTYNIGGQTARVRDIYLSRNLTDGTNSISVADIQHKLTAGTGISISGNTISCTLEGVDYQVYQELPQSGVKGVIYLVPNNESDSENVYDEYIWVTNGNTSSFEPIGNTRTNLANVVTTDTEQVIEGLKKFKNKIRVISTLKENSYMELYQDSHYSAQFKMVNSGTTSWGLTFTGGGVKVSDKTFNLGDQSFRFNYGYFWKEVYASNTFNFLDVTELTNNRFTSPMFNRIITPKRPVIVSGTLLGMENPILFINSTNVDIYSADNYNAVGVAICPDGDKIRTEAFKIDHLVISLIDVNSIALNKIYSINGMTLPANPAAQGSFVFKSTNGTLGWGEESSGLPTLPTTDGKYKLVCNVVNGVPTMTWELEPDGMSYTEDASQSYSGNITTYQGDGDNAIETYIKFDTPPTSNNDCDAFVDMFGTPNGLTSYSDKTKVYVWSSTTYYSAVSINNVKTTGGVGYANAVEVILTGNYDIALLYQRSGGSND